MVAELVNVTSPATSSDESGGLYGKSSFTVDAVRGIVCDVHVRGIPRRFHTSSATSTITRTTLCGTRCRTAATRRDRATRCATPTRTRRFRARVGCRGCSYAGDDAVRNAPTPDPTNLARHGRPAAHFFTGGQLDRALATLISLRSNLIGPGLGSDGVDGLVSADSSSGRTRRPIGPCRQRCRSSRREHSS